MNKYLISLDIGGTTFSLYLFDEKLNIIKKSPIDKIINYRNKNELLNGIEKHIISLLESSQITLNQILCLGISAPGPLDCKNGIILDTPNLIILKNTKIIKELERYFSFPIFLNNDANLFAFGEWYNYYNKKDVFVGITLGTGLGLGIIIDGKIFSGAHGMGAEYGISPYKDGVWEDVISIEGIENFIKRKKVNASSPKELHQLALKGEKDALEIWNDFGRSLGIFTSHILNLLDPSVVSFGGGLSKAYSCFEKSLIENLEKHSPTFKYNSPIITHSKNQLDSAHIGAARFALKSLSKK